MQTQLEQVKLDVVGARMFLKMLGKHLAKSEKSDPQKEDGKEAA